MLDIWRQLTDLIAPPSPTVKLLRDETPETFIRLFQPRRVGDMIVLSDYHHQTIKAAITENKFQGHLDASKLLAALFKHWLTTLPSQPTILVPIPLSKERQKLRGYNQVERIISDTGNDKEVSLLPLLTRNKDTTSQTTLRREERFQNVRNVYTGHFNKSITNKHRVIVVDDVMTTGATLHSASQALSNHLPSGCELILVAIAH